MNGIYYVVFLVPVLVAGIGWCMSNGNWRRRMLMSLVLLWVYGVFLFFVDYYGIVVLQYGAIVYLTLLVIISIPILLIIMRR